VKKCGLLKILHDKFKSGKKNESVIEEYVQSFSTAKECNKEIEPLINKSHEILNPLRVLNLFKDIPDEVKKEDREEKHLSISLLGDYY
jgi:DNA-directed RNA polymerase III subunit RPC1